MVRFTAWNTVPTSVPVAAWDTVPTSTTGIATMASSDRGICQPPDLAFAFALGRCVPGEVALELVDEAAAALAAAFVFAAERCLLMSPKILANSSALI